MVRGWIALGLWVVSTAVLGCDEATTAPGNLIGPPVQGVPVIQIVTSDRFVVTIVDTEPLPLRVRVLDANGRPIPSVWVKYNVLVGSAVFSADSTLTDALGFTEVQFLPLSLGTVIIEARVSSPQAE